MTEKEIEEKIEELESAVEIANRRGNLALRNLADAVQKSDDKRAIQRLVKELQDDGF